MNPSRRIATTLATVFVLLLSLVASAQAAPSIFWSNYETGGIARASLTGGSGFDLPIAATSLGEPYGLAIDAAAGRIYWANFKGNSIGYANLDGSDSGLLNAAGATVSSPSGPSIDPVGRRIYWVNATGSDRISYANLDGSGGGVLNTTGATQGEAYALVVSSEKGRVYWGDYMNNTIDFARLDGSGGRPINTIGATVKGPVGVAIDSATNRVYWANYSSENSIAYAGLNGKETGMLDTSGATVSNPNGLAIDTAAGRIYWGNAGDNTIYSANLGGGGGARFDTSGATTNGVSFPVLIEPPRNVELPTVAGKHKPGSTLTCSQGTWALDQSETFLALAPQSLAYQWYRNGKALSGVTASTATANKVGAYSCGVTATNFAGPTGALSAVGFNVNATVAFKKTTFNRKKGTATVRLAVTGAGRLDAYGKGVANASRKRVSGTAKIVVRSSGKARIKLKNTGKAKVKATVSYTPEGGKAIKRRKTIVLKKKLR